VLARTVAISRAVPRSGGAEGDHDGAGDEYAGDGVGGEVAEIGVEEGGGEGAPKLSLVEESEGVVGAEFEPKGPPALGLESSEKQQGPAEGSEPVAVEGRKRKGGGMGAGVGVFSSETTEFGAGDDRATGFYEQTFAGLIVFAGFEPARLAHGEEHHARR